MGTVSLLLAAVFGLLVGPFFGTVGARFKSLRELFDGFAIVLVAGLCLAFVLPHVVSELGLWGLGFAGLGVLIPFAVHRLGSDRKWAIGLVALVLTVHVVVDGTLLFASDEHGPLGWAIVAHRLPVGFAIVMVVRSWRAPGWTSWGLASLMVLGTALGFVFAPSIHGWFPETGVEALEALVAGTLLHVVLLPHSEAELEEGGTHTHDHDHDHSGHSSHASAAHTHDHDHDHDDLLLPHSHSHGHNSLRENAWAAFGAILGLTALLVIGAESGHHAQESAFSFVSTFGVLVLESAPALLLGYAMAGFVPLLLTPSRISSLSRFGKLAQALRGVAFGLPLPVCSCGVLPLYESLIRRGAPPAAAMAFFVATPELGLDAVLLSVPLLGSSLTIARVTAAFVVAVLVALLVAKSPEKRIIEEQKRVKERAQPLSARIQEALRFGFVEVFDHTMPWIGLGLVIAAMAEPMLSHDAIGQIPPALQVPLAALIGIPVYVCASGATPIAALALHKGMSAGATIAFLIAGPATNVTTFGTLARLHGRRATLRFGIAVTLLAVVAGWVVDSIGVTAQPVLEAHSTAQSHSSVLAWVSVFALVGLSLASLVRQGPRGALQQILQPIHSH